MNNKKRHTSTDKKIFQYMNKDYLLPKEIERFQKWITDSDTENNEKDESLYRYWLSLKVATDPETAHRSLDEVKRRLGMSRRKPQRILQFRRVALKVAAVCLPFVLIGGMYWVYNQNQNDLESIALDKDPVAVRVETQHEESKQTVLTDGSKVWINTGSQIAYQQKKTERVLKMSGEAFFDVKKEDKPFVVSTDDLTIKVLGTRFNVEAYPDKDQSVITLLSGKVDITTHNGKHFTLTPNMQLVYQRSTGNAEVKTIEQEAGRSVTMWTEGWMWIESKTLIDILDILAKTYQVSFEIEPDVELTNDLYTVGLNRNDTLSLVLSVVCDVAGGINYTIRQDGVVVIKK